MYCWYTCITSFTKVLLKIFAAGQIQIEEHPSSLLLAEYEIGNFSCRAHCEESISCFGQWIVNNETLRVDANSDLTAEDACPRLNTEGRTFLKPSCEVQENEHILRLSVNASKLNNNLVIQCEFQSIISDHNFNNHLIQSTTARVLVLPSE